jgi:hypothetical protein
MLSTKNRRGNVRYVHLVRKKSTYPLSMAFGSENPHNYVSLLSPARCRHQSCGGVLLQVMEANGIQF